MPGKKKKYNARFPPARIKKIMQSDEEVGKVAAPVPVIISRALEMFAETLLGRAKRVTNQRGARTLTPSHLKFCIHSESRFDFLRDLVSTVPDLQGDMDNEVVAATSSIAVPEMNRVTAMNSGRGRGRGGSSVSSNPRPPGMGTGKRRGRPPKIQDPRLVQTPGATSKRVGDKFVDDEYDCDIVDEDEDGDDYDRSEIKEPTSAYTNGGNSPVANFNAESFTSPPSAHQNLPFNRSHSVPQGKVQMQFGPTTEASLRYQTFSSPYNVQRSVSNHDFPGMNFKGFQGPPPPKIPNLIPNPTPSTNYQLQIKQQGSESNLSATELSRKIPKGSRVFSEKSEPSKPEHRNPSLPPPAPVYSGSHARSNAGNKLESVQPQLYPGFRNQQSSVNNTPKPQTSPTASWTVLNTNQTNAFTPPGTKSPNTAGPSGTSFYSFSTSNNTFALKAGANGIFTMAPIFPTTNLPSTELHIKETDASAKISKSVPIGVQPSQNAHSNPISRQELDEDYDC